MQMKLKDLAIALGISASMAGRLARRGMPTETVEKAAAWRKRHLNPFQMKGQRIGQAGSRNATAGQHLAALPDVGGPIDSGRRGEQLTASTRVDLVDMLGSEFQAALEAENMPRAENLLVALRAAMRAVPVTHRACVQLSASVWDELTAHLDLAPDLEAMPPASSVCADTPEGLSDEEADNMGAFWYRVAIGEWHSTAPAAGALTESTGPSRDGQNTGAKRLDSSLVSTLA